MKRKKLPPLRECRGACGKRLRTYNRHWVCNDCWEKEQETKAHEPTLREQQKAAQDFFRNFPHAS